jgi:hypothetical protein
MSAKQSDSINPAAGREQIRRHDDADEISVKLHGRYDAFGRSGNVKKPSHVERESAIMPLVYVVRWPASIPRHQLIKPVDGVIVDAGEHVCKPGLLIDVVELRRHDQR